LVEALIAGIELLASELLSTTDPSPTAYRFESARDAFLRVLSLSCSTNVAFDAELGGSLFTSYAGPRHLASLLLAASDAVQAAALTKLPSPNGADVKFWETWLGYRADRFPFVWPNHREAIAKGFYQTGTSAVMVLPTGAGKTTVSSLKIAGALARGKKVIFLAPTHALVEQLTDDLQEMFLKDILGSVVSSDFDMLLIANTQLQEIEVMTPERCLAMLSFAPDAFADVGLWVFDECHLLSPQSGKIRRSLDGMLCLLAFNRMAPDADTLFLSAMLKNGEEFAKWIAFLTRRTTIHVDLLWKPSRQARGVVIYKKDELEAIKKAASAVQRQKDAQQGKKAKGIRTAAEAELVAHPQAIWGLQHNWLSKNNAYCSFTAVADSPVPLTADIQYGPLNLRPNANKVAAQLAATSAKNGLKTIVFVNTKADAISTASDISHRPGEAIEPTETEAERWSALEAELGDLKHSLLDGPTAAVPHNSAMLRLERDLAERMFRRSDGAKVIVATPTLAQGLNLPAQLAILAGDKRASSEKTGREDLEAHEILNAAARAGRAGHLANGVVLLVPEPIISFADGKPLDADVVTKLRSILPEDDRCVVITDPLEVVLDRLAVGHKLDRDVLYTVNRMAVLEETEGDEKSVPLFGLHRSLAAFSARAKGAEADFDKKVAVLKSAIEASAATGHDTALSILVSKSGLPPDILERLRKRIADQIGSLPESVADWVKWVLDWLGSDEEARALLLFDVSGAILAATGNKKTAPLTTASLGALAPGVLAWIAGRPLREIEVILGGDPDSETERARVCPRARELVSTVIPRGLSFVMGLVAHVVGQVDPFDVQGGLDRGLVEGLGTAVRRGFDTVEKLSFAAENKAILGRVQMHKAWEKAQADIWE
jgi:superfamily II DNA/RNA helicase